MRLRHAALAVLGLACTWAAASGLQVSPVTLTLQPSQNADGLWLSNTGDNVVHAQVRVYRWTQENGEEKLTPSRNILASPPMLELAEADRQLIRVIRTGAPPGGAGAVEDAYRLIIDELPVEDRTPKKGLRFVLRYSVPIFVEPAGAAPAAPQLTWSLRREGEHAVLDVANRGGTHAQLAALSFVDAAGRRTVVHDGLLGYVLPGAQMRWTLKSPVAAFATGGSMEAMLNGSTTQQSLPPIDRAR
ncbi:molecular chaperone [Variovorax sp. J22P271]|uniref:fimbrial biogenesis chaperone n=1 Tax=Variovorax davisae TaxID=3053515 RepID=UPI002574E28A|nr:molecular chaperone [Variovorax sp. J22P271]MDM0033209.1 molecular chaperone [Variovorax sp. J22P271]